MSSLRDNFAELLTRIRHGREVGHASFEPLYYLVFPPHQILEVKRQLPAWSAKLQNEGWEVHVFSMAEAIAALLGQAPLRQIWLSADRSAPLAWEKTNRSLANTLARGALQARLEAVLEPLQGHSNAIVFVTDLEALHPYLRIGAIETHRSPIFKAVQKKQYKALYRALTKSPKSPEYAVGAGSEPSHIAQSAGAP